jgi:pimeloyl-ACP methyl ester carboxylesterase
MAKATPPDADAEMETVTSADGTEIAFERTGSGPPLVLVHGSGASDHRRWEIGGVRSSLAEHVTVHAMDRRGRGGSGDAPEYDLEREAEDVVAIVEAIDEPVTVLGHSYGANVALEASVKTDDVAKLVLYEPGFAVGDHEFTSAEAVAEMNDRLAAGENEQALLLFCREVAGLTREEIETFRSDPTWQDRVDGAHTLPREERTVAEYEFDADRFSAMSKPTLLLSGGESPRLYKDATNAVHDALPNSRIATFEGQQHVAMNDAPERFVDEVLAFVRESN